jgi:predicted permease
MLAESMLLSAAGTLVGVAPAYLGTGVLVRIIASGRVFERLNIQVVPDLRLVLYTAAIAVFTGLLFGIAPSSYAFRRAPAAALRQTASGETRWWRLFGKGLVTAQVALSILLATAAVMFLGHVQRLRTTGLGFRSDHVLLLVLDREKSGYTRDQAAARYRELLARLEAIPGVRTASISGCSPLRGCGWGGRFMSTEEHVEPPDTGRRTAVNWVSPRYFETLGIPLARGRDFQFRDIGRPKAAIVTESMARLFFPSGQPIGKHVKVVPDPRFGEHDGEQTYEVVGVVGDAKGGQLRDPEMPGVYFLMFQGGHLPDEFELRTSGDPAAAAGTVQRVAREVVGTIHVERTLTLAEQVDGALVPERLIATLATYFGVVAAALAGIGLFGLLAFTVTRRTSEIGVRMALGATPGDVIGMVLRDAAAMVAAGLACGALLVIWSRPLASRLVEDLKPQAGLSLVWGSAALAVVALAAAYVPALRASRVDPMVALRHE